MKNFYSFLIVILLSCPAFAQNNNLYLNIDHKIDNDKLVLTSGKYTAWNAVPFYLTRLQYYISKITVIHDGGQKTEMTDLYLLPNPNTASYSLGNYDIQNVESLEFYIGVPSAINHGDPTIWPNGHPLGPQNPAMHWGWAAGYRFAAIEGYSDSGNGLYADKFEFHAIGDALYTKVTVTASSAKDANDNLVVSLNANYNKLFETVDLEGGMIIHGSQSPNTIIMSNFKNVFTASSTTSANFPNVSDFKVSCANPCREPNIQYDGKYNDLNFEIYNASGQKIYQLTNMAENGKVDFKSNLAKGFYIISFKSGNKVLYTNKLLIQD